MKLGLATLNDSQHEWCKIFVAAVDKDSGGRIKGEIYPASQLGSIPREVEGVQFGSIQGYIGPPEFLSGVDERYEIPSTPGIVDGIDQAVRLVHDAAFKRMMLGLGANKGIHGVALFISQPSSVIARDPDPHALRLQGQEAARAGREHAGGNAAPPGRDAGGDDARRRAAGDPAGHDRRRGGGDDRLHHDALSRTPRSTSPRPDSPSSSRWRFSARNGTTRCPRTCKRSSTADADAASEQVNPWEVNFYAQQREVWKQKGGELIELPPAEHASMMKTLSSIGDD